MHSFLKSVKLLPGSSDPSGNVVFCGALSKVPGKIVEESGCGNEDVELVGGGSAPPSSPSPGILILWYKFDKYPVSQSSELVIFCDFW